LVNNWNTHTCTVIHTYKVADIPLSANTYRVIGRYVQWTSYDAPHSSVLDSFMTSVVCHWESHEEPHFMEGGASQYFSVAFLCVPWQTFA